MLQEIHQRNAFHQEALLLVVEIPASFGQFGNGCHIAFRVYLPPLFQEGAEPPLVLFQPLLVLRPVPIHRHKVVVRVNDGLAYRDLNLGFHPAPAEFLGNLVTLLHQVVVGLHDEVFVAPSNALRVIAPQVEGGFEFADPVFRGDRLRKRVHVHILVQRQPIVETDPVVLEPLPPEDLPVDENHIPVMRQQFDASVRKHHLFQKMAPVHVLVVILDGVKDNLESEA